MDIIIPSHLARSLRAHYGPEVRPWLKTIPDLVLRLEKIWGFKTNACMLGGVASVILKGELPTGEEIILKIPFATELVLWEALALEHWQGRNCSPRLLELDKQAMLLEYIVGEPLTGNTKINPVEIINLIQCLHDIPHPEVLAVPSLSLVWNERLLILTERLKNAPNGFKTELKIANELSKELFDSAKERVLLHGDLHLGNILQNENNKLYAIDPKPRYGDPGWDIAYPSLSAKTPAQRIKLLEKLACNIDYPLERAKKWQWLLAFDDVISAWQSGQGELDTLNAYADNLS